MSRGHDDLDSKTRGCRSDTSMAAISPLPPPEEVFIDWLMSVPHDASLEAEARRKITMIDRRGVMHPDVLRLRTLLAAVAGVGTCPQPTSSF